MSNKQPMTLRAIMSDFAKMEQRSANLADAMFKVAQQKGNLKEFLAACAIEEAWIVSPEATSVRMDRVPRKWVQYKSDIKGAFARGLDPKDYQSYSAFKAAKVEVGKATNTETNGMLEQAQTGKPPVKGQRPALVVTQGDSADGKAEDLALIVSLIAPLNTHARAKCIKEMEAIAKSYRQAHDAKPKEKAQPKLGTMTGRFVEVA